MQAKPRKHSPFSAFLTRRLLIGWLFLSIETTERSKCPGVLDPEFLFSPSTNSSPTQPLPITPLPQPPPSKSLLSCVGRIPSSDAPTKYWSKYRLNKKVCQKIGVYILSIKLPLIYPFSKFGEICLSRTKPQKYYN